VNTSQRTIRSFVALGLAVGLVVAACGSSKSTINPFVNLPGTSSVPGNNNGGGGGLTSGLSSNLDALTSYQFSEEIAASGLGGSTPAPGTSESSFLITGTVINKPTKAMMINDLGVQFITIGTQSWSSFDGTSWYASDSSTDSSMADLLPGHDYASWFDNNSTGFTSAGDETKNGVACIHFKGSDSLGSLYSGLTGVSASFQADLWVAKDGNYPVSGVYGFFATSGGQGGSFGYKFDVTHVNDPANAVTPPTNVVAIPI
jgi:hypothetical protein